MIVTWRTRLGAIFRFCAELAVIPCVLAREMNDLARFRIVGASGNYLSVHDDLLYVVDGQGNSNNSRNDNSVPQWVS
jgi:hypothetical protein